MTQSAPLWSPSQDAIDAHPMTAFRREASARAGRELADYDALHRWSIEDMEGFWTLVWDFCGVIGERGDRVLVDADKMPGAAFFPDARLNFAENLLRKRGSGEAMVFAARTRSSGGSLGRPPRARLAPAAGAEGRRRRAWATAWPA